MGIKNRLISLMDEKHINANELATKADVPPSTIYSILQRDSSRMEIDLIMKIAHALNVSADDLLSEELTPNSDSDETLNREELQFIQKYRKLDQRGKDSVQHTLDRELSYISQKQELDRVFKLDRITNYDDAKILLQEKMSSVNNMTPIEMINTANYILDRERRIRDEKFDNPYDDPIYYSADEEIIDVDTIQAAAFGGDIENSGIKLENLKSRKRKKKG